MCLSYLPHREQNSWVSPQQMLPSSSQSWVRTQAMENQSIILQPDLSRKVPFLGICNTVGRVLSGFISTLPGVSPLLVNNISITIAGVVLMLTPLCTTYATIAVATAAVGLFCCKYRPLRLRPLIASSCHMRLLFYSYVRVSTLGDPV